jgi:L-lactate dehydrogenase (cytochrome)
MIIASPEDFRISAKKKLPAFLFDYLDGGAGGEETLRRNRCDLDNIQIRQKVLVDVSSISLQAHFFGDCYALPIILGPIGLGGMYARRGEVQAAMAARHANVPFCLSTVSLCGLNEVIAGSGQPPWFQLYVIKDRAFMTDLLDKAWDLGCRTLVFTVDMPLPGVRNRDLRSGMSGPHASARRLLQALMHPRWAIDVGLFGRPHRLGNLDPVLGAGSSTKDYMNWLSTNFDPTVTWDDLSWIRKKWQGALVIKGILDVADAVRAADLGADGIVVSNHGGRQLDGATSTSRALPEIAELLRDRVTLLSDSGVRNGRDVAKMLALGAHGVLLGRAWVYALATGGQEAIKDLIGMIERELRVTMALAGVSSIDGLDHSVIIRWKP